LVAEVELLAMEVRWEYVGRMESFGTGIRGEGLSEESDARGFDLRL
jgi:hypothetical protein